MTPTYDPPTEPVARNGFGLAALILGLVGLLFGLVPLTGFMAVILGITGIALGLTGWARVRRGQATNRWATRIGVAASGLAIGIGVWGISIVFGAVDQLDRDIQEIDNGGMTDSELEQFGDVLEEGGFNDWADCINSAEDLTDAAIAQCDQLLEEPVLP